MILFTNDDGIKSEGISALTDVMSQYDDIKVFAPDSEKSSISHAISLRQPVRVKVIDENHYSVSGTPADCINLAVKGILDKKPDMVISGINAGANLGDDVHYSGTVAGAREGFIFGISSISVSLAGSPPFRFIDAAKMFPRVLETIKSLCEEPLFFNVNIPNIPYDKINGILFTHQGRRIYNGGITKRIDPNNEEYFWLASGEPTFFDEDGTDFQAITSNNVSITPLTLDTTNYKVLNEITNRANSQV